MIPVSYNLLEQAVNSLQSQMMGWHLRLDTEALLLSAFVFDFQFVSGLKVL